MTGLVRDIPTVLVGVKTTVFGPVVQIGRSGHLAARIQASSTGQLDCHTVSDAVVVGLFVSGWLQTSRCLCSSDDVSVMAVRPGLFALMGRERPVAILLAFLPDFWQR